MSVKKPSHGGLRIDVSEKALDGPGCLSPANLFSNTWPWKNSLTKVKGAHAWKLNPMCLDAVVDDDVDPITVELAEST